jgi:hypothetical protein
MPKKPVLAVPTRDPAATEVIDSFSERVSAAATAVELAEEFAVATP